MHIAEENRARLSLLVSMLIWGSIGVFRRYIALPSGVVAMLRGAGGMLFLLLIMLLSGKRLSISAVRRNALPLLLSGACIGFNWILLFEAYRYTSVASATLCYYMAPVIVLLLSPLLLRERLTARKLVCVLIALAGMALVSGLFEPGQGDANSLHGVLLGLSAAVFYAGVILTNKRISGISPTDRTIIQLGVAAAVLLPYTLLTGELFSLSAQPLSWVMLAVVAVVHTGLAYTLYFGSMSLLRAQTVALMSYIDPLAAILLSALLLGEPLTPLTFLGALLILGGTLASELPEKSKTA